MPKRVWKRCMEFKMKTDEGKLETYFIDRKTGYAHKGSCSKQFHTLFNEGTLAVSDKKSFENIPQVPGLLTYREDNKQLYVNKGPGWEALSSEKDVSSQVGKLKARIESLEKRLLQGKNCADLYEKGVTMSGTYQIDIVGFGSFKVFCDMTTSGGGWTVFQRRLDGSVDFYRGWQDYEHGFGDLNGEFWLGLDKINRLTTDSKNKLRIDMEDTSRNKKYAEYDSFAVGSEQQKYQLSLGKYAGTAGDSFSSHNGIGFTTKDSDNDKFSGNCAVLFKGAWWYTSCHVSNLNGLYHHVAHKSYADGVNWYHWKKLYYSLKSTSMNI